MFGNHLSRRIVTGALKRPTSREATGRRLSGTLRSTRSYLPAWSCSEWGLHGRGAVTGPPVSSYLTFSPLPLARRLFSVALSLGSPPPDVIRHPCPAEPGLSSCCEIPFAHATARITHCCAVKYSRTDFERLRFRPRSERLRSWTAAERPCFPRRCVPYRSGRHRQRRVPILSPAALRGA